MKRTFLFSLYDYFYAIYSILLGAQSRSLKTLLNIYSQLGGLEEKKLTYLNSNKYENYELFYLAADDIYIHKRTKIFYLAADDMYTSRKNYLIC
jgi:hypothetical protein